MGDEDDLEDAQYVTRVSTRGAYLEGRRVWGC